MSAVEGRDYGQEAMMRRLGLLAKQRREEMGLGRVAFAELAGLGSDSTVQQFEFGQRWPRPQTLRKLEVALGWRNQVIDELTESKWLKASSITFADLDKAPEELPAPPLSAFSTTELLREVASRIEELQTVLTAHGMDDVSDLLPGPSREDLYGHRLGTAKSKADFDLAASDDHVEGEDDND